MEYRVAQHLSEDALNAGQGEASVIGFNDPPQQLMAQHLQNHAHIWWAFKDFVSYFGAWVIRVSWLFEEGKNT